MRPADLCLLFFQQAAAVWELIEHGRSVQFQLSEQTLTDLTLLNLHQHRYLGVQAKAFTQRQESVEGADWEMWLRGRNRMWLGFRVQAKVLNLEYDRFEHLHYRKDSASPYQAEALQTQALSASPPRFPIYCLFTQWNTGETPAQLLKLFTPLQAYGCSVLPADFVTRLRAGNRRGLKHVLPFLLPWHHLVCPFGEYGHMGLANAAWQRWREWADEVQRRAEAVFVIEPEGALGGEAVPGGELVEPSEYAPGYVMALLAGELEDEMVPEDLSHVLVVQEDGE